jgi:ABC-type phosphate transport system substrate-binding protein
LKKSSVIIVMVRFASLVTMLLGSAWAHGQTVVVIGNASVKKMDATSVMRIYTGRTSEIEGAAVHAVNAPPGTAIRNRFLSNCLQQDENRYTAHWTVRKYVGKGVSPREFARSADVLKYVAATPGAIGYLDDSELVPGVNVLLRCGTAKSQSPLGYVVDMIVSHWSRMLHGD